MLHIVGYFAMMLVTGVTVNVWKRRCPLYSEDFCSVGRHHFHSMKPEEEWSGGVGEKLPEKLEKLSFLSLIPFDRLPTVWRSLLALFVFHISWWILSSNQEFDFLFHLLSSILWMICCPIFKDGVARLISGGINTRLFNRLVLSIVFRIENGFSTSSVTLYNARAFATGGIAKC